MSSASSSSSSPAIPRKRRRVEEKDDDAQEALRKEVRRKKLPLLAWHADLRIAQVLQAKGKHINRMGFSHKVKHWLLPEEAAFIIAEGEADMVIAQPLPPESQDNNDVNHWETKPMHLAEAYAKTYEALDFHRVSLIDYYAFVALKKLRFNVYRKGVWAERPERLLEQSQPQNTVTPEEESRSICIRFDVYSPQSTFAKNTRGTPNFRVATCRPADKVPFVPLMRELAIQNGKESTKLRVAIFDGQAVSFVQVEDYELPDISAATAATS